jgi:transcription elongation factor GreA
MRIEEELHTLITVRRPETLARLAAAADDGALAENLAYMHAEQEQALLEGRIATLRGYLLRVELIAHDAAATIGLGSQVTVRDEGEEATHTIVGPLEGAPTRGRISHVSPLGQALLGHVVGDDVQVEAPSDHRVVTICAVAYSKATTKPAAAARQTSGAEPPTHVDSTAALL